MEDKDMINAVEGFAITNMSPLLGSALSERASAKNEETHRFIAHRCKVSLCGFRE